MTTSWHERLADADWFDLSELGLIAVRGADAAQFLQGQLTNDVRALSATHTQLSGHCNQKGRLLALFRVLRLGDAFYLQLPQERLPALLARLGLFVLRSRVTLEDASAAWPRFGLAGAGAPDLLRGQGLPVPETAGGLAISDGLAVLRHPGDTPRFELLAPSAAIAPWRERLAPQCRTGPPAGWMRLDIAAGIPQVYDRTADTFVPQMLNLQRIDGLSLTKGCYTGQEVVARMQYLGTLKRRLYLAQIDEIDEIDETGAGTLTAPPAPGDPLHVPASRSGQGGGWVVDAAPRDGGGYVLLVVAEIAAVADGGAIRLGATGPALRLEPPPYGFATEPDGSG